MKVEWVNEIFESFIFLVVSIVCDSFWKNSTLIFWGWSEIEPCIYSRFSVEHNYCFLVNSLFSLCSGFLFRVALLFSWTFHSFTYEDLILVSALRGLCSAVMCIWSLLHPHCVDCNLFSPICILYTLLVKLVRVMDCILLVNFLISLLGIFFLFQKNINI